MTDINCTPEPQTVAAVEVLPCRERLARRVDYLHGLKLRAKAAPWHERGRIIEEGSTELLKCLEEVCGELRALSYRIEHTSAALPAEGGADA